MTLILARTSVRYSLMVSDRRVTQAGNVFDPQANKTLVFADRNAVVVMGYTGLAHIGRVPTDQWLAQTLTGRPFIEGRGGRGTVPVQRVGANPQDYFGRTLQRLARQLTAVKDEILPRLRREWRALSFDLLITGNEWNHGYVRPICVVLSKPRASTEFQIHRVGRFAFASRISNQFPVVTSAIPDTTIAERELRQLGADVDGFSRTGEVEWSAAANYAEAEMVAAIRGVSKREPVVGSDCMSVLIGPLWEETPAIRIRYLPEKVSTGVLSTGQGESEVPVVFTPWIISAGSVLAPSVATNLMATWRCGPYEVRLEAPQNATGVGGISGQQRRSL